MNKHIEEKKKQIITVLELLKDCKTSSENFNSVIEPFFNKDPNVTDFEQNFKSIPELPDALNRHVKLIFEITGDPDIEIYHNGWTIMSLNKCLERYNHLCNDNPDNVVFDFGFRYMGMGHIEMVSCNLYNHLLFYHMDGGSNGWDREANYKELVNFNYQKYKYIFFNQWLSKLNKEVIQF